MNGPRTPSHGSPTPQQQGPQWCERRFRRVPVRLWGSGWLYALTLACGLIYTGCCDVSTDRSSSAEAPTEAKDERIETSSPAPRDVPPSTVEGVAAGTEAASTTATSALDTTTMPTSAPPDAVPSTTAPASGSESSTCFDELGDGAGNHDIVEATVGHSLDDDLYVFLATAVGPSWEEVDWAFTFGINELQYVIAAGRYADGTADVFVYDVVRETTTLIDESLPFQTFVLDGRASVAVPAEWIADAADTDFDWDIVLEIDGVEADSCAVEAFGQTGTPQ